MARQIREKSQNGIYHVMIRGIDRKDIFIDDSDYKMFLKILKESKLIQDEIDKERSIQSFRLYSYCLMSNHVHLLIQEIDETLSQIIHRISIRYVMYFNTKYMRIGHLFQNRFKSEPCDDISYFLTLVRYIHQNPVKAGICQSAEQHPWNSWNEIRYAAGQPVTVNFADICDKEMLFKIAYFEELDNLVHAPIPDKDDCIDIDNVRIKINDQQVRCIIKEYCSSDIPTDICLLDSDIQKQAVIRCLTNGATVNQLNRITGLNKRLLSRLVQ